MAARGSLSLLAEAFGARIAKPWPQFRFSNHLVFEDATASDDLGRIAMRSRSFHMDIENYDADNETVTDASETNRKNYARSRSARSPRRRTSESTNAKVPLGMSGRRNRRWAW
jgi:hypothetical protein